MSFTAGVLATVVIPTEADEPIWVRFANGTVGCVDPNDGPDVDAGSAILVSFDNGAFIQAPAELFPKDLNTGLLATVVTAEADEPYWVRYEGGGHGPLHRDGGPEVATGEVVLVSGRTFATAPAGLMPAPRSRIGVVRRVEEARSLVETDHSIQWLPHHGVADWEEWSTVEINDGGVVARLDAKPMRYRDDPPPQSTVQSRFRVDPNLVTETFGGIQGLDPQITELRQVIELFKDGDALGQQGMLPIRGVLLAGESGTGKTMLARAVANEADAAYFHVRGPEIASKWVNESEEMLRALMDEADSLDRAVVFFDEIDSLGGARSSTAHEMSNKLVTQFLALLDGFDERPGRALILGATNRPEALDPTMLRSGRFDRRINFRLPTAILRDTILQSTMPSGFSDAVDTRRLAALTEGWSSADLRALWTRAYQYVRSEGRSKVLHLDCEISIELLNPQVTARQIKRGERNTK